MTVRQLRSWLLGEDGNEEVRIQNGAFLLLANGREVYVGEWPVDVPPKGESADTEAELLK